MIRYIQKGREIDAVKAKKRQTDAMGKHGLKPLWEMLEKLNDHSDSWASDEEKAAFQELLFEFDMHDRGAQAARYPFDTRDNQTLSGLAVVDMGNLKAAVHKIVNYLETTEHHLS